MSTSTSTADTFTPYDRLMALANHCVKWGEACIPDKPEQAAEWFRAAEAAFLAARATLPQPAPFQPAPWNPPNTPPWVNPPHTPVGPYSPNVS